MKGGQEGQYYCGIDVGTDHVRCVIGEAPEKPGELPHIVGFGQAKSFGMRKGVVIDAVAVAQSIDAALADAERVGGVNVDGATFSINGIHIKTDSSKGVAAVPGGGRIGSAEVSRALEAASIVQLPSNQRLLEVVPTGHIVDGHEKVQDGVGMMGNRLEVEATIISVSDAHIKSLEKAIGTANISCNGMQPAVRAGAEALLTRDQLEMGVIYADIGYQTSGLAVFEEQELKKLVVVPMGSAHVTNDLAIGLRVPVDIAEELKREHADVSKKADLSSVVEVDGDIETHKFRTSDVELIIGSRLEEIFEKLLKELKKLGQHGKLPGGVVVGGGGSLINGIEELASEVLRLPAKRAEVDKYKTSTGDILGPEWASAVGLMLFDDKSFHESQMSSGSIISLDNVKGIISKFRKK